MSERLRPDLLRAELFQAVHIYFYSHDNYESYCKDMLQEWERNAKEAHAKGETARPLWLRRTDEMGSEFGAVIDYVMPIGEGIRYFAAIDIDGTGGQTDISVLVPSKDGSGEPIRVTHEAYTLPALQRAIEYVELHVQSTTAD